MMLSASLLAALAVKSLVLAGATLTLLRLTKGRSPAERSLIAHFGLLAIVLLPAASILLPEWAPLPEQAFAQQQVLAAPADTAAMPIVATGGAAAPGTSPVVQPSAADLAVWLYAVPLVLMFATMLIAVMRLFGMRRRADVLVDGAWLSALAGAQRRMGFKHGTALLVSDELRSPISWGVLRPTILLDPRAVSAVADAEAIIAHELAHVARLDWAKLLVARLACALFWFNPLVWMLARESHQLREEAADDTVLLTDIPGSDYATLLVNAARHDNKAVLIAAHGVAPAKNSLRRRVVRALDVNVRRGPVRTGWGALSLVAVLAVAAPLAAFTTSPSQAARQESGSSGAASVHLTDRRSATTTTRTGRPLTPDDIIAMRAVGVEPADLKQMRDAHGNVDPDAAIAAKATGITPAYVSQMRDIFPGAEGSELVGAIAVGVDGDYARAMRGLDARADLDMVIGARAVGVTPAYAREIRAFFPDVSLDDLTGMRATGVSGADIRAMRAAGMSLAEPDDVIAASAVLGRRGPPANVPRGPTVRAVRDGATAVVGPGGVYATRRNPDGSISTAVAGPPPPGDDDDDNE